MLEVSTSAVNFGEVAVNDIPSYRQFTLKNTQDTPLCVHVSASSLDIRFQLENENAFINDMDDRASYNELFDFVNLIDTIELLPNEEKAVIAFFRAEKSAFGHLLPESQPVALSGTINFISTAGGCATLGNVSSVPNEDRQPKEAVGMNLLARDVAPGAAASPTLSSTTLRSESMAVPMYASVYLSQLQVSPAELQATMAPNKTQVLDFTVTNVGSRPLAFVIRSQTMAVKGLDIALYEAERFEEPKLGHRVLLDSHASINLSVMLRTTASSFSSQQYQCVLQCDNLRDSDNTALVSVNVSIVPESQGDLVTISDATVNFGDVYRGTRAVAEVGFLNVEGRGDVSISLSSSYKRKANGEVLLSKDETTTDEFLVSAQKGMQYMKVIYKPTFASELPETEKVKFELDFTATSLSSGRKQRIVVWCSATLFTSTVIVPQKNVNFGDCQVGEVKRRTFTIENQSPLPGSVLIQLRSKIISIEGASARQNGAGSREIHEEFTIGPSSKLTITLRITPQRVNPTYHKQLSIMNLANPNEDVQIINIEANNMAPPEAKMHNELYTWSCRLPDGLSQSQPLCTIANVPILVPYTIKSRSEEPITLRIRTTCPEVDVFYCGDPAKTRQLEAIAFEWRRYCVYGKDNDVVDLVNTPPERIEELRKELVALLADSGVVVAELPLEPKATITVFAVIIRSTVTPDAQTKEDGILVSVEGVETPRFVRLSYRLCGSVFDLLGQKTRNFGEVNIGVKKVTKLPIENKCKSVAFVKIEKSRSVTAGHIRIEHTDRQFIFVVVRPFATKEVELSFFPGIKGSFDEKVKLTNVLDPLNSYTLTLKATVIKADTFDVSPDSWNFGSVMLPPLDDGQQLTRIGAKFMVANTSKTRRQIRVRLDVSSSVAAMSGTASSDPLLLLREVGSRLFGFSGVDARIQLDMELSSAGAGSTRRIEEQIEKLEQKLKIHERKKKFEKMEVVKKRIEALRRTLQGEEVDLSALANNSAEHDYSESEDESAPKESERSQSTELMIRLLREGVPLPAMAAGESVAITFGLTCSRLPDQPAPPLQTTTLNLLLYEAKDREVNRIFPIDITLVRPEEEDADVHAASPSMNALGHSAQAGSGALSSMIFLESGDPGRPVSSFMGNPLVILRNTIVNDHAELTFLVKATSNTTVVVLEPRRCGGLVSETLDARFKFFPRNGVAGANEPLRIVAECTPRSVGPQRYFVPIKNLQNAADVQYLVVELNPTEEEERVIADPKQLVFSDLITPCDPKALEAKLVLIRSRFQFPHSLLVRSNKPSQVLLFEDHRCTVRLRNPIQRVFMRETVRVYAKFVPSPKSSSHNARQVRAGIVVEAIVANGEGRYTTIGQSVVDVTARIGSGLLEVPSTKLQFGTVGPQESVVKAAVPITNPSDTFPVCTKIVPVSDNVVVGGAGVVTLRPRETKEFHVELLLRKRGLCQEYVAFHNLTCSSQGPITVELALFQRDDAITPLTRPSAGGDYVLPISAVARGADGHFHLHNHVSATIAVLNSCAKDIVLASQCPLPLFLSIAEESTHHHGEGNSSSNYPAADGGALSSRAGSPASMGAGGGRARSAAHHTQKMMWTLLAVPDLDGPQTQRLLCHDLVSVHGVAQVQVAQIDDESRMDYNFFRLKPQFPSIGQCVMLLPFVVPLAISEGRAEPTLVNLGVVGQGEDEDEEDESVSAAAVEDARGKQDLYDRGSGGGARNDFGEGVVAGKAGAIEAKRRQSSTIHVKLTNLSQHLPLQLKVECQPIIRFTNTQITIRPGETVKAEARLRLQEIPTQGPFHYEAFFVNALNPENDIAVTITGQYYWKVFRLSTKTSDNLHDSLTLPALHVEGSNTVPAVLSEEKLTISATEPNVELQLMVQNNPKLEGLVQLQVLHYDATSSVSTLTFQDERAATSGGVLGAASTNNASGNEEDDADGTGIANAPGTAEGATGNESAAAGVLGGLVGGGAAGLGGTGAATAMIGGGAGAASNPTSGTGASGQQQQQQHGSGGGSSSSGGGGGGGAVTASGGSSAQPNRRKTQPPPPPPQPQQKSQTVRVRCVLLRGDLGGLAVLFSGFRNKGNVPEALTFDRIPDLEKRRNTSVYSNMWLGTVKFSNRLTKNEDVAVFGQLEPFSTFTTPSKLSLTPSRMVNASSTNPTSHHHLVYAGELRVTNSCDEYLADLAATALISDQLALPITVQITGCEETLAEEEEEGQASAPAPSGTAEVRHDGSLQENPTQDTASAAATLPVGRGSLVTTTTFTNVNSATSKAAGATQNKADNPPPPEQSRTASDGATSHRFRLGPKATVTLRILVHSNNPQDMKGMQQSSLEQLVALVVLDENVNSSVSIVRLNVTPLESDLEDAPLYIAPGSAATATGTGSKLGSVGAPSAPPVGTLLPGCEAKQGTSPEQNAVAAPSGTPDMVGIKSPPGGGGGAAALEATSSGGAARVADSLEMSGLLGNTGASGLTNPSSAANATPGGNRDAGGAGSLVVGAAPTEEGGGSLPVPSLVKHTVSLKGCTPTPDCAGAYSISYSIPRGEAPQGDITIRNNLPDRPVVYTASVTSQSPLLWILLPSNSGVLEAGETQPLRLNVVTSEVGSFVGYVAIRNNANPYEVVYLRLSAEIFVPSSGEGLFEVVTISGYRVASNEVRNVSMGHLYGSQTSRAYIALELVNRSNVPLEFPVSVVKPFRIDTKPVHDSASLVGLYQQHRRRHPTINSLAPSHGSGSSRVHEGRPAHKIPLLPSSSPGGYVGAGGEGAHRDASATGELALTLPPPLPSPTSFSSNGPVFEGKLVACHIHGVPTQASQKYLVVDPRSRVRLAFVLSCLELRVPDGYGVFGEADVIFKCKQARDANFTFRVKFEAYQPTFQVNQEVEIGPEEGYTRVALCNALPITQSFVFRSQSPVVHVVPGTGTTAGDEAAFAASASADRAMAPRSFATVEVRGNSTGYFAVRIDVLRAAALLNFDKDDGVTRPALLEHAFILNAHNPRERTRIHFRQRLKDRSGRADGLSSEGLGREQQPQRQSEEVNTATPLIVPSNSPAPILGGGMMSTSVAKPLKVGGQHIGEHFIMHFAQDFTSTLSFYEERLVKTFAHYGARRDGDDPTEAAATASDDESDGGSTATTATTTTSSTATSTSEGGEHGTGGPAASPADATRDGGNRPVADNRAGGEGEVVGGGGVQPQLLPVSTIRSAEDTVARGSFEEFSATAPTSTPLHRGSLLTGGISPHVAAQGTAAAAAAVFPPSKELASLEMTRTSHTGGRGAGKEERKYGLPSACWRSLHSLLIDLTWLVDELVLYSISLRNSRLIQGYCVFLTEAVCNHPVVKAWGQYKSDLPAEFNVFAEYLEMLDFLPCPMPS